MRELKQEIALLKDSVLAQGQHTAEVAAERDACKAAMAESADSVQVCAWAQHDPACCCGCLLLSLLPSSVPLRLQQLGAALPVDVLLGSRRLSLTACMPLSRHAADWHPAWTQQCSAQ